MKIVYVTQIVPYPPHGGVLQRGYNLLRELAKNHRVHLLAFHHPDELPRGEPEAEARERLGSFCDRVDFVPLWPKRSRAHKALAVALAAPYPHPFSVLAQRSRQAADILREVTGSTDRPDLVHLDTIALAPYRKVCGAVPCVLAHHNVESQLMERRAAVESLALVRHYLALQARRLRRFEAVTCPQFSLNIMVSETDAELMQVIAPGIRTALIPNGVDVEYFTPRTEAETPAIIHAGGMQMFANRDAVDWFLDEIWPVVKSAVPGVRFLGVGANPTEKLLRFASTDPQVEASGFVPDVRPWVARAGVFVVPLRVGGGTRLKMVDAMAQGKAIVATTVGAEGIHGEDGRHFILADDPETFAQQVIRLLLDHDARRALGATARERVETEYGWPLLAGRLAGLYSGVIAER